MLLTDKQQTRLEELRAKRNGVDTIGRLTPSQQTRLAELRSKKQGLGGVVSEPLATEEQIEYEKAEWLQQQMAAGKIAPTTPTFLQRVKGELPQATGGMAGGLAGAKLGAKAPIAHPLGRAAAITGGATLGAFVGGMGGKGYQQTYQMTRPGAKPMTLGELYTDQAIAGIEEAAAELIGRGIAKVGAKALAPVRKRLLPGATKLSKALLKKGAHLTPAQMTESRIIDTLEGMAEKSFFGGGKLQRLKTITQPAAFAEYIDDVVRQIGKGARRQLSPEDVGEILFDTISGEQAAFKATAKAAYGEVDRLTKSHIAKVFKNIQLPSIILDETGRPLSKTARRLAGKKIVGGKVSLVSLKKFAKETMKTAAARKGIGSSQAGDTLLKRVIRLDNNITFKQAQSLRSALIDERAAMGMTKDKAIGLAKQFIKITDDAMEEGAKQLSPEAYGSWRIANKFYRTGRQIFDKKLIRTLTKNLAENPEIAVRKIFRPGATEQIKVVKNLVDKKTWTILKEAYLERLLTESADVDKVVLGKSFLQRLNKIGQPALKEIYSGEELRAITSIGELGQLMQRPTGGSGGMLIQLTQAGAVLNLGRMVLGGAPALTGETTVILVGPPVLSRMLANPHWAKLLSVGIKLPRGTPAAATLGTRIIRTTLKIRREQRIDRQAAITQREIEGFGP